VSAMLAVESDDWLTMWVFCAPVFLALGLTLQVVVTTKRRRTTASELVRLPARVMDWAHQG
jgi:hypothetical protein